MDGYVDRFRRECYTDRIELFSVRSNRSDALEDVSLAEVAFANWKSTSDRPYEILLDYGSETHHPSERARFAVKTDEYEPSVKASTISAVVEVRRKRHTQDDKRCADIVRETSRA